jgi:hypothetical protein
VGDRFLREHRLKGRPTLPIVVALEAFAESASLLAGKGKIVAGFRDVVVPDSLQFTTDEPVAARIIAEQTSAGVECRLVSDLINRQGKLVQKEREHFLATVNMADKPNGLVARPPFLPSAWYDVAYPEKNLVIHHGPAFRCLRQCNADQGSAWGRIVAPDPNELFSGRRGSPILPAAVLDACLFTCGICVWLQDNGLAPIPRAMRRLHLGRAPRQGEECIVRVARFRGDERLASFDLVVFGDNDDVLVQLRGYDGAILKRAP